MTILYTVISIVATAFATFFVNMCKNIPITPKKTRKRLIDVLNFVPVVATVIGIISINIDMIFSLFHTIWWYIGIFSLILAVLPPVMAGIGRCKNPTTAEIRYVFQNFGFNMLGLGCVWCMLFTLYHEVPDFRFLRSIPVVPIITLTIPLCIWVVLSYQYTEQQEQGKSVLDHDTSLAKINQLFNILHLFNAFFWTLTAAALMVAYTLYCRLSHVEMVLDIWYLLALSGLLVFFYFCGFHRLPHIRMVCLSNVPAILIASVYWMSWFTVDSRMFLCQSAFIVIHSLIYVTIVYLNMGFYKQDKTEAQSSTGHGLFTAIRHPKKTINIIGQKLKKYQFYIITIVIVSAIYFVFIFIPLFFTQQSVISFNYSQKIITEICEGTDRDAAAIFEEMKESEWANQETEMMDCVRFADFIYRTLKPELIDKNIITPDAQSVSYEQLKTWYES